MLLYVYKLQNFIFKLKTDKKSAIIIYSDKINMHIPYKAESIGYEVQFKSLEVSYYEKIWQFMRFTVVTGIIFTISFFSLNFEAYQEILIDAFNPQAKAKAQEVLGQLAGERSDLDPSQLLEVLPDKKQVRKSYNWLNTAVVPTDNRLVIPKLGKSVPLVDMGTENIVGENWGDLEDQIQDGLRKGVVHYPGTAKPGEFGNVFLTGHSSYYPWDPGKFKDVFATLEKLEVGDRYYVYKDQKKYTYEIFEKYEVQPSATEVLAQPKDQKISTLMTCVPVGTTLRRLIIRAAQV